jgi:hypothetical protein
MKRTSESQCQNRKEKQQIKGQLKRLPKFDSYLRDYTDLNQDVINIVQNVTELEIPAEGNGYIRSNDPGL